MRIYVLGSTSFFREMVQTAADLRAAGFDGWIHPDYEAYARGEKDADLVRIKNGEQASIKKENDYLRQHHRHILESDAVIFVNNEKNGIKNYIGGNALIEMGGAYVNDKKIFLLNDMPTEGLPYLEEIEAMDPICLHGDLAKIREHAA